MAKLTHGIKDRMSLETQDIQLLVLTPVHMCGKEYFACLISPPFPTHSSWQPTLLLTQKNYFCCSSLPEASMRWEMESLCKFSTSEMFRTHWFMIYNRGHLKRDVKKQRYFQNSLLRENYIECSYLDDILKGNFYVFILDKFSRFYEVQKFGDMSKNRYLHKLVYAMLKRENNYTFLCLLSPFYLILFIIPHLYSQKRGNQPTENQIKLKFFIKWLKHNLASLN